MSESQNNDRVMIEARMELSDVEALCQWIREKLPDYWLPVPGDPPSIVYPLERIERAIAKARQGE